MTVNFHIKTQQEGSTDSEDVELAGSLTLDPLSLGEHVPLLTCHTKQYISLSL